MSHLLSPGDQVYTVPSHMTVTVEEFLGGGGQGEVYRANLGGKPVALKWLFPSQATGDQRIALETLIKKGPPTERFLWPMEITESQGVTGFGYVMKLRDNKRFKSIVDLMKGRADPSFKALAMAGHTLAHSFLQLHSKGLCYRDISFGNVFFDPLTGDVLICDNDNVAVDDGAKSAVRGTPRFMAPEVVRDEARPSTQSDLFSLGVLLFYMFMIHHPLEGRKELAIKCLDLPAMTKLYGTEPVFIFDPNERSNEAVPGVHDHVIRYWLLYPQSLRDLFTRAFTEGIRDPTHGRVRESEWRSAMIRLKDSIIYCGACGKENFYDGSALKANGGKPGTCWNCRKELKLPYRIRVGNEVVMLNHDTQLFPHHTDPNQLHVFGQPIAGVAANPQDPSVWGLRNLSQAKWTSTTSAGVTSEVPPGKTVTLAVGTRINFGTLEGEIRA